MSKANFCARQLEFALSSTNKDFYQLFLSADQFLKDSCKLLASVDTNSGRRISQHSDIFAALQVKFWDQKYSNSSGERTVCLC